MKNRSLLLTVVSTLITSINLQTAIAQSWNITGNNNATGSSKLGTTNLVPLRLFTNNAERIRIETNGRVGIGTTTPVNIFTVKATAGSPAASWVTAGVPVFVGFAEAASSEFYLATASNTPDLRPVFSGKRSRGTLASPAAVVNNDYISSITSAAYDGNTFLSPAAINFYVDGAPSSGHVPARISFETGTSRGDRLERLKILSNGNFNFNNGQVFLQQSSGNVGIGTTTPATKLEVRNGVLSITNTVSSATLAINRANSAAGASNQILFQDNSAAKWALGGTNIGSAGANNFSLYNYNLANNALTILNSNSNVGIGTTSPGNKLEVHAGYDGDGIAVVGSTSGPKDAAFKLFDNAGHSAALGLASANNAFMSGVESGDIILTNSASGKIHFGSGAANALPIMTVAGSAVGIGTRNPGYALDVVGRMRMQSGNGSGNGTAGTFLMNSNNSTEAAFIGMLNDNYLGLFGSNGASWGLVMNTTSGNVGIGTSSPAAKMHIRVSGFDAYQGLAITNANTGGKTITINQGSLGKLNFTVPGIVDLMTMDFNNQNVGIGTVNPGYKLDVCGTIRAKELRVESGWCDYVFEKNYKLKSIDELEQFINDNKHLPGILPASEVEKEGLKVAEMNKAMMEKIEELTLYVIQLSKENKKMQKEIDALKK